MKLTVIGVTNEVDGFKKKVDLPKCRTFSGKNAGICYMKDSYFNSSVSDEEKASARFNQVVKTNHHSIADHVRIEVLFEDISKMLAIVLNSLQDYSTSEKSGRYTVMTGNSSRETELYDKWRKLFRTRIIEEYPDVDDDMLTAKFNSKYPDSGYVIKNGRKFEVEAKLDTKTDKEASAYWGELLDDVSLPSVKLAQENARYVLSVFTRSTTMGYSTSLRQWNYIYDWCIRYMAQFERPENSDELFYIDNGEKASYFDKELYNDFGKLSTFIFRNLYVEDLRDTKGRCFEFLTNLADSEHPMGSYYIPEPDAITGEVDYHSSDDNIGVTYSVSYPASFVHIAQAERHRTLKYFMQFNPHCRNLAFFIPPIIRGTSLEKEWLDDLNSVSDLIPQATLVGIIETGHISDFILKCKERLCGRAQWEIMHQTYLTAKRFIDNKGYSKVFDSYVEQLGHDSVNTKCKLVGQCKEPCNWIKSSGVFSRLI